MARIMSDANAQLIPSKQKATDRPGIFTTLMTMIGGWPAATGLATATFGGVAIGLTTPETFSTWTQIYLTSATSYEIEDLMPSNR